jgi:hypothetical protein
MATIGLKRAGDKNLDYLLHTIRIRTNRPIANCKSLIRLNILISSKLRE